MAKVKFEPLFDLGKGMKYAIPKIPDEKTIPGYELASLKQKFQLPELPSTLEFNKLTEESQLDIIASDLHRRQFGYWCFVKGIPIYLAPTHYFYMQHWNMAAITQTGMPDFRYAQLKYFYFYDFCEKDPDCYGGIMLTQKRFSKTEGALAHLYNMATNGIRKQSRFSIQSFNATEASKLFTKRIMRSHKLIRPYLIPISNETKSTKPVVTELTFYGSKTSTGEQSDSLDNTIDHRPTLETALQGERPAAAFVDEPGSINEMSLLTWWTTTKQQLATGNIIFGRAWLPTTLETMKGRAAEEFKELYYQSDYRKRDKNNHTVSGMYSMYMPHYEGREGFIDQWGFSMTDEAKQYRENELENATPSQRRKLKQQFSENEEEAFDVSGDTVWESEVEEAIKATIEKNIMNPHRDRPVIFFESQESKEVAFRVVTSEKQMEKACIMIEDARPNVSYKIGVDSIATTKEVGVEEGSKFAFTIFKTFELDKDDYMPVMTYEYRPDSMDECWTQLWLAARHYSQWEKIEILGESNVGQGMAVWEFFSKRGAGHMLKKHNKKVWLHRGDDVIERQITTANRVLRIHVHKWKSNNLLRQLLKAQQDNTDLADSALMGMLLFDNYERALGVWNKRKGYQAMPKQVVVRDGKGRTKLVWKDTTESTSWNLFGKNNPNEAWMKSQIVRR